MASCGASFGRIFDWRIFSAWRRLRHRFSFVFGSLVAFEIEEKIRGKEKTDSNINGVLLLRRV